MDTSPGTLAEIPLFPLGTVLFRGGFLPLKIFEPRYADMVSRCMKGSVGFGVVLIKEGSDAMLGADAAQPDIFDVGSYATIVDFDQSRDGLFNISAVGGPKFKINRTRQQSDQLLIGEVTFVPEEKRQQLGEEHAHLVEILRELLKHPLIERLNLDVDFEDARSVSWRLADLLPVQPEIKQSLLQMQLPRERLAELHRLVNLRG